MENGSTTPAAGRNSSIALPLHSGDPEAVIRTAEDGGRKNHRIVVVYSGRQVAEVGPAAKNSSRGGEAIDVFPEPVAREGILSLQGPESGTRRHSASAKAATGSDQPPRPRGVYRTERPVGQSLTLAPSGRRILFTQRDQRGGDGVSRTAAKIASFDSIQRGDA